MMSPKVDIMSFNKDKLNLINNDFEKLGGGLKLSQFVKIMLHHSDITEENHKIEYVEALVDAFKQIDVNGDKTLEWDEFSNYIVETGIAKQKKTFIDVIRNYHLSTNIKDRDKHEFEIYKLFYFPQIKQLIVLENNSKKVKIYDNNTGTFQYSFDAHNGSLTYAEYINKENLVITSGSDNAIMVWRPLVIDKKINYKFVDRISTKEIQLVMKWIGSKKMLLTAGFDLVINCYRNLNFEDNGKIKGKIELKSLKQHHKEIISDILIMEKLNYFAACDVDGLITLWNLANLEIKQQLRKHMRGVLSLACIESKNLLFSAGYEHEVFVWDIIVGKNIFKLQGHSQSLISIKILHNSNQIITGDVSGIFKVWDTRSMTLNQTFSTPTSGNKKTNCFCTINTNRKQIVVGVDKLYFFDYEESQDGNLADSKPCIAVFYNDVFNTFVTGHLDCIKIWDANGELKHVFRDITDKEISYLCFDDRKRKLFIGDVEGKLNLINILNGVQMKYFKKHKDYISSLVYFDEYKRIISASWDGYLHIHDDNEADEMGDLIFRLDTKVSGKINSCNTLGFFKPLNLLAAGWDNGSVTLTNMKTLGNEGSLSDHKKIKLVSFIANYPALIVCDDSGMMHFWSLIPTKPKKPNRDFIEENKSFNEYNRKDYFPVKAICFEEKSRIVITGDETGYLKAWNIKLYIEYLTLLNKQIDIPYSEMTKSAKLDGKRPFTGDIYSEYDYMTLDSLKIYRDKLELRASIIKEWQGHRNGVNYLSCYSNPIFYISAGMDCKVLIWNENFEKIGSLMTLRDPDWNIKIDIEGILKKRYDNAVELYTLIKNTPEAYENLFGGEVNLEPLYEKFDADEEDEDNNVDDK